MRCFGEKKFLAIEYDFIDDENTYFELWVANMEVCSFYKDGKKQDYKWDISDIVEWLIANKDYVFYEEVFPLEVNANSSLDFYNKSNAFDSEDIEQFDKWYTIRQEWYFRHSWYANRAGSYLADVLFRKVGDKIEIEWDNRNLYDDIQFVNEKGLYYVDKLYFQKIIDEFIMDYKSRKCNNY